MPDPALPRCPQCYQPLNRGATGKFPLGEINPDDQGELRAVIGVADGRLLTVFGKSIEWLAFTPLEALAWAEKLVELAESLL